MLVDIVGVLSTVKGLVYSNSFLARLEGKHIQEPQPNFEPPCLL